MVQFLFFFLYVNRSVSGARSWWAVRVPGLDYARVCVCVCLRGAKGVLRAVVVVGDECGVKGVL